MTYFLLLSMPYANSKILMYKYSTQFTDIRIESNCFHLQYNTKKELFYNDENQRYIRFHFLSQQCW